MKKNKAERPVNKHLSEDLVLQEVKFSSWEDWFNSTIASHESLGNDYSTFTPPSYMVPDYGSMPLPPWLRHKADNP